MGADHTAGLTVFSRVDHRSPQGQVALSRASQIERPWLDSLGLRAFLAGAIWERQDLVTSLLHAVHGIEFSLQWLVELGRKVRESELAWNRQADPVLDRHGLPPFLSTEPLGSAGPVFDVPDSELQAIWG
jgi:aldehyde:ferredoxin oxidoreductase